MTCRYCATVLPSDSLFCGECGGAVSSAPVRPLRSGLPPLVSPVPQAEPWMNASAGDVCEQCGSSVTPDDIFCGECGFVVAAAPAVPPLPPTSQPSETEVIDRLDQIEEDEPDLRDGERFVLQFSTGESYAVFGSGLVGRSPKPEPGEYFDQMVRIVDASRSVSKTHLEFGQEAGSFWVKDRFSGNGTIVREPESHPVRCRPEHRYRLVRGSRVDLGEQFFIVS